MSEKRYIPGNIEGKWQERWNSDNLYQTNLSKHERKYYVLVELPYTSGDLHMGHWFTFTMGDIVARFKRMQGFNVLYPNGFDTFGLPAENAAIKNNMHPKDWTFKNIERMRKQFATMGAAIDWGKTAITCDPEYYRWNQWIFLKMYEKGIAYRGKAFSNWCPNCKTILADENVEAGRCWRCGTEVIQKEVEQWFFKLTAYADRLLWTDPPQVDWPRPLQQSQNNWIGKNEGINITYHVEGREEKITCFTTRPDTNFGATFVVLAPEHPLALTVAERENEPEVKAYIKRAGIKSELERKEMKEKTGVFTGSNVINNLTGQKMPIWVADYVLMGYGTGAVVGVPGHDIRDFEFAQKYNLPVKRVVVGSDGDTSDIKYIEQVQEGTGIMINSGFLDGLDIHEAIQNVMNYLEEKGWGKRVTMYHLHDWSFSRQRYWGTPIPIIYCDKCGIVPVPEKDLPVELPYEVDYIPQGKPPLATAEEWVKVKCHLCAGPAQREVETMDGFVDNSWYFYRYLDYKNDKEIFSRKIVESWIPVDIYIGGAEHTVGHTLYSRFFTKFFYDMRLVTFNEYAKKRVHHGIILGPDGHRMSKSRGNVVNPDEQVKEYGADAVRMYLMFLGHYDITAPWNPSGINGIYNFLKKVWVLVNDYKDVVVKNGKQAQEILAMQHRTIKRITEDLEKLKFNTAISGLMEYTNFLRRQVSDKQKKPLTLVRNPKPETLIRCAEWDEAIRTLLLLLAPFAPHISEELWEKLGYEYSIHRKNWPKFNSEFIISEEVIIPVQVNGKLRDTLIVQTINLQDQNTVEEQARESEKVRKYLEGQPIARVVYVPGKLLNFVTN